MIMVAIGIALLVVFWQSRGIIDTWISGKTDTVERNVKKDDIKSKFKFGKECRKIHAEVEDDIKENGPLKSPKDVYNLLNQKA